jgi:5-hydroxyisourate hydrolase-like protein (transthyretin family)
MNKLILITCILLIHNVNVCGQNLIAFTSTPECNESENGVIVFSIDPAQLEQDWVLPFDIDFTNLETGDNDGTTTNSLDGTIDNLVHGEYEVEFSLGDYCHYTDNVTVGQVFLDVEYSTTTSTCCSGSLTATFDGDDNLPYEYSLHMRVAGSQQFVLIEEGQADNISVNNLCQGRYRLDVSNGECFVSELIFVNNEEFSIDLVDVQHVTDCNIELGFGGVITTKNGLLEVEVTTSSGIGFNYRWKHNGELYRSSLRGTRRYDLIYIEPVSKVKIK